MRTPSVSQETLSYLGGMAMTTITWLHLSDLHVQGTESIRDRVLFDNMLVDISEQLDDEGLDLDAVFFTGDLAFSGQVEEYALATKMLDEILDACGLADRRDRVFIVPGNHDVDSLTYRHAKGGKIEWKVKLRG